MRDRIILILICLLIFVGFLSFQLELILSVRPPSIDKTYTPLTTSSSISVGSYDVLGYVVSKEKDVNPTKVPPGKHPSTTKENHKLC